MQYSSGLQRYFNEHIHLPNTFFDNPLRFVKHALMEKGAKIPGPEQDRGFSFA